MAKYIGIEETSKRLGISKRRVQQMCVAGKLPGARKKGGQWQISVTADARFGRNESLPINIEASEAARFSKKQLDAAAKKVGIVTQFEMFAIDYARNGSLRTEALNVYTAQNGVGKSSLERWIKKYREQGILGL